MWFVRPNNCENKLLYFWLLFGLLPNRYIKKIYVGDCSWFLATWLNSEDHASLGCDSWCLVSKRHWHLECATTFMTVCFSCLSRNTVLQSCHLNFENVEKLFSTNFLCQRINLFLILLQAPFICLTNAELYCDTYSGALLSQKACPDHPIVD